MTKKLYLSCQKSLYYVVGRDFEFYIKSPHNNLKQNVQNVVCNTQTLVLG